MAFELTEDFVKDNGITEDQAKALTTFATTYSDTLTADLKKEYDETYKNTANTNADNIINDAIKSTWKATGFELERNQGEKNADYMTRYNSELLKDKKSKLDGSIAEYEEKLKNFKGDEATAAELSELRTKFDDLQKKTANYDDLVGFEEKYNTLSTEHLTMKERVVFGNEKPSFPDTVDEYRAKAKWNEFMDRTKEKYDVELVDGESVAILKENKHKIVKLKDLVAEDEEITKLLEGRQQNGTGGKPVNKTKIEGIPFDVPQDMSSAELSNFLTAEISKTIPNIMSKEFSDKFGEYYNKIKGQKTA